MPPTPPTNTLPYAKDGLIRRSFGLKSEIMEDLDTDYHSVITTRIRENGNRWEMGGLRLRLAAEFGFCYGVDKAIDLSYETRRRFPDKRLYLTGEIIHNQRVNRRLLEMDYRFLSGQYAKGSEIDEIRPEDVVVLPAFGVETGLLKRMREIGCIIVDTTCGSVMHVWKRVERYAREGFTSVIHGKWFHEETIATCSHVTQHEGGRYLVVLDKEEARQVCDFLRSGQGAQGLQAKFTKEVSEGFDFTRDLEKIGVANQTTMLSSESLEIGAMVREAMVERHGEAHAAENFRSFDTICHATQDRQDAVLEMMREPPDVMIVVGGLNSSNTGHLCEIASQQCPTYHIDDASRLLSPREIMHKPPEADAAMVTSSDWLPERRPLEIGLTAGASTPNKLIGEVVERLAQWEL